VYEAFTGSGENENESYYSAVPFLDSDCAHQGLPRPPGTAAPGQGSGSTNKSRQLSYKHYEFAKDADQSGAELLPHKSPLGAEVGSGAPTNVVGGNDRMLHDPLEYGYEAIALDRGERGDIYDTVASGSVSRGRREGGSGTPADGLALSVAAVARNYEVDERILLRSTGVPLAASGILPGERGGANGGVAGEGQEEEPFGSEGYAYAVVEVRCYVCHILMLHKWTFQ